MLQHFYSDTDRFSASNGFMVAAAISSYSAKGSQEVPKDIGSLEFYRKSWSADELDEIKFEKLESRRCLP